MVEVSLIGFTQFFRDELLELKVHKLSCLVTMHKMITILPSSSSFFFGSPLKTNMFLGMVIGGWGKNCRIHNGAERNKPTKIGKQFFFFFLNFNIEPFKKK